MLVVEPAKQRKKDEITQVGDNEWRITLKWSWEALAQAAFEMTFWYMAKVGEVIYAESVPKAWNEMMASEAGRNAVKMMLYYALLRCRTNREEQRAIALYNSYCFGYALGMNFRSAEGRREMLWVEDLDEILISGQTKYGVQAALIDHWRCLWSRLLPTIIHLDIFKIFGFEFFTWRFLWLR